MRDDVVLALDMAPLTEPQFTGIAIVTLNLLKHFARNWGDRFVGFNGGRVVSRSVIEAVIAAGHGRALSAGGGDEGPLARRIASSEGKLWLGFFCAVKSMMNVFDLDVQLAYDLTPLLLPECHMGETVHHYCSSYRRDYASNAMTICISEATRSDFVTYLNVPRAKTAVAYPGADRPELDERALAAIEARHEVDPYLVVVGTVEPRKNIELVLAAFKADPTLLQRYRAVFVGKEGWGDPFGRMIRHHDLWKEVHDGRIVWTGYVGETERALLVRNASFLLYPSLYEGFGLPVVEAMSLGCPVVASFSSSIPEVGGDVAVYFDPLDMHSLIGAIDRLETQLRNDGERLRRRAQARAAKFSWAQFCQGVESALETAVANHAR
ncbi:MAG: glycosyltransferase family 4 protein [Rhodospirillaceae bacterium]|nr:glycosyltransferase family 4 protein [Rhodospirillaceae bacterium]